jgi:hypothetical protein
MNVTLTNLNQPAAGKTGRAGRRLPCGERAASPGRARRAERGAAPAHRSSPSPPGPAQQAQALPVARSRPAAPADAPAAPAAPGRRYPAADAAGLMATNSKRAAGRALLAAMAMPLMPLMPVAQVALAVSPRCRAYRPLKNPNPPPIPTFRETGLAGRPGRAAPHRPRQPPPRRRACWLPLPADAAARSGPPARDAVPKARTGPMPAPTRRQRTATHRRTRQRAGRGAAASERRFGVAAPAPARSPAHGRHRHAVRPADRLAPDPAGSARRAPATAGRQRTPSRP